MTARPTILFCLRRLNPWRFKGMIKPMMALSFDDSGRISARKGMWMVEYLRARRGLNDWHLPYERRLRTKKWARQNHLNGVPK